VPVLMTVDLAERDPGQVADVVDRLRAVLGEALVGAYLHGSAILGGLRPGSDLDVLAVTARPTTDVEKDDLVDRLLVISGKVLRRRSLAPSSSPSSSARRCVRGGTLRGGTSNTGSGGETGSSAAIPSYGVRRKTPTSRPSFR
jgi:predicted nucleotidyltransferase